MRVRYTWNEPAWREAVTLSNGAAARRPMLPGLTWALILLPLTGGVGEFILYLWHRKQVTFAGSIVPMLLVLFAVVALLLLLIATVLRRRKRDGIRSSMPSGEWEAALKEGGWSFAEQPVALPASLVVNAGAAEEDTPLEALQEQTTLRPWSELVAARHGERVIVLMHADGFHAIPTVSLTPEQGSHLYRLVARKLPQATALRQVR